MKILFLGDVMGRAGRRAITENLPRLRESWKLDFVVVNGENATSGMGLSGAHAKVLLEAGADCVTLGDHAFDQKDMLQFIEHEPRVIRPLNFSKASPGKGARLFTTPQGRKVLVMQALGQVFMKRPFDDPFSAVEPVFKTHPLGGQADAIIVDFHCEATSEKMAMGHWCDGRASLVVGTHTHVPTADAMILPGGTAHLSDAGMCGDYNSVIGMEKHEPLRRFITGMPKERFTPRGGRSDLVRCLHRNGRPHRQSHPHRNGTPRRTPATKWTMTGRETLKYSLFLVVLGMGWAFTQPMTKLAVSEGYKHFGLIFWQVAIGAALMAVINTARGKGLPMGWRQVQVYGVVALIGTLLPNTATYQAAVHLPSGLLSILLSMIPIFAFPVALALGNDRFEVRRLGGLILGFCAILMIVLPGAGAIGIPSVAWIFVALIAGLFYAFEGNYVAKWGDRGAGPDPGALRGLAVGGHCGTAAGGVHGAMDQPVATLRHAGSRAYCGVGRACSGLHGVRLAGGADGGGLCGASQLSGHAFRGVLGVAAAG